MLRFSYRYYPYIIVGRMISENFGIQLQGKIVCMGGVMVSVLVSSAVDPCTTSAQVIYYEIDICCFSTKHALLRSKSKD